MYLLVYPGKDNYLLKINYRAVTSQLNLVDMKRCCKFANAVRNYNR